MKKILIALLLCFPSIAVFAGDEFICDSPEAVLNYYFEALAEGNEKGILEIYWGIKKFHIYKPIKVISYKILREEELLEDQFSEPLWAKKGTIQMDVEEYFDDGTSEKYFYAFRKIDGKWYLVGHGSFDQPE